VPTHVPFEIASLQLTPSFKMGALQLKPTSKIVTMRLAPSQQPQPGFLNLRSHSKSATVQAAVAALPDPAHALRSSASERDQLAPRFNMRDLHCFPVRRAARCN